MLWLLPFGGNSKFYIRAWTNLARAKHKCTRDREGLSKAGCSRSILAVVIFMPLTGPQRSTSLPSIVNLGSWHLRSYLDFLFSTSN
jgi:hypothetical protein